MATTRVRADVRLFSDVLGGAYDPGEIVGRGTSQGIDLALPWAAVLVLPEPGSDAGLHALETNLLASLPQAVGIPMATAAIPHAVVVFRAPGNEWVEARKVLETVAGMLGRTLLTTGPSVGPERLRRRYAGARSLLPFVPQLAAGAPLLEIGDFLEVALLTEVSPEARRAYLEEVLGPVDELSVVRKRRLLQTMEAVAQLGKAPKAVAAATGTNRKTVCRHIEWFEEQTGLCLDRPEHLNRVLIGLHLRKVGQGALRLALRTVRDVGGTLVLIQP